MLFYPTAIGWHPSEKAEYGRAQHESWELIQRSHAVANGCFVCAPNRIGHEIVHGDRSAGTCRRDRILGPVLRRRARWPVIARASVDREEMLMVDCDLARVEFSRTHWPFLRDRRVDAYGDLTKRYSRALLGARLLASSMRTVTAAAAMRWRTGAKSAVLAILNSSCPRDEFRVLQGVPAEHGFTFPPNGHVTAALGLAGRAPRAFHFPAASRSASTTSSRSFARSRVRAVHLNVPNIDYEEIVRARLA